jgi:hypothetical protein
LKIPVPAEQLYEGRSLYAPEAGDQRLIYLNSYAQYAVIARDHFVSGDRKADEGGASSAPRSVFAISNEGSKTIFTEDHTTRERAVLIRPFDDFQENLLRNYSFYCQAVCQARQTASLRSRP